MARHEREFDAATPLPIEKVDGVDARFRVVRDRHERLIAFLSGESGKTGGDGAFATLTGLTDGKDS